MSQPMSSDATPHQRLLEAMPSTVSAFYEALRQRWPRLWATLPQHRAPLEASLGALQHFEASKDLVPAARSSGEELVSHFENIKATE